MTNLRRLEDIAKAIVTLLVAVLLAYILISLAHDAQSETTLPPLPRCMDNETRERLQTLTSRSIDQGFQRHVSHLFDVLMGNPNAEQYNRARLGMQNGIKGYLLAQENTEKWIPPLCEQSK